MSPLNNQPYFTVKISSFGVSFFIDLNGVSIYREYDDNGQVSTYIPVNHYMAPDINKIDIHALPSEQGAKFNPNSNISISLLVAPNSDKDSITEITRISFKGSEIEGIYGSGSTKEGLLNSSTGDFDSEGDISISPVSDKPLSEYKGGITLSRELNIPSNLPKWAFLNSDTIPDLDPLSDEDYYSLMDTLLIEYMKVQNAIKDNSIDSVIELFAERNKELDAAFYYPSGTTENKIRQSLKIAATDPDLELVELTRDKVDFTVEDNRKLISLTRPGLKPAIALNFKSGFGSQRYNLIFRKTKNNWILTR